MTDETWRIVLRYLRDSLDYAGAVGIGVVIAGGGVLVEQLQSGQPINWTPVLAVALAALLTALRSAQLNRPGQPRDGLSDEDVERIAQARERIRKDEIRKVREAGARG